MKMQTRVVSVEDSGSAPAGDDVGDEPGGAYPCPRCSNDIPVRLEKEDPHANTCYRCRSCGHIFSPRNRPGD